MPAHWRHKRRYLQGHVAFHKPAYRLPDYIAATGIAEHDPIGLEAGTLVRISPADYAEAEIVGTLAGTTVSTVTIRREDPRVGEVAVHFPKIGYVVEPA